MGSRQFHWSFVFLAWLGTLAATLGSLYFSEVQGFEPCVLCWWQRIFMYPLVIVLGLGLLFQDVHFYKYAMSLAVMGLLVAIYHNLLFTGIIPEGMQVCSEPTTLSDLTSLSALNSASNSLSGASCTETYINWFGFITIPVLSLVGYAGIIFLLTTGRKK